MKYYSGQRSKPLGEPDIADQFPGVEIEFNDKVTLFPVQLEKEDRPRRKRSLRDVH